MKTTMMCTLAALTLTFTGSVVAADPQDPTVQIRASDTYQMKYGEFDDYANRYALDNGYQIKFQQRAKHYYAQLKGELRTELYPVAHNVFMTAGGTRVEFKDKGEEVAISNFERLPMAVALEQRDISVLAHR
jgi:hypothetical protein